MTGRLEWPDPTDCSPDPDDEPDWDEDAYGASDERFDEELEDSQWLI